MHVLQWVAATPKITTTLINNIIVTFTLNTINNNRYAKQYTQLLTNLLIAVLNKPGAIALTRMFIVAHCGVSALHSATSAVFVTL